MPGARILVLGAGSAGRRHVRHLATAGAEVVVADPDPDRAVAARSDGAAGAIAPDRAFDDRWDGVVVASPSAAHAAQVAAARTAARRVLVEKPLAVSCASADALAEADDGRVAVGYNLRFHPPVRRVVDAAHAGRLGQVISARVWFGQWLPDWRPGTDWRASYSARRDLGGGILLDASHELDLVCWLFGGGRLDVVGAVVDRRGPLEMDVEDTVAALLAGPGGAPVTVDLDCLSRRYRRGIEVVGTEATMRLDWARSVVELEDGRSIETWPADTPIDDSYGEQARRFLAWIDGGDPLPVDASSGAATVALAGAIRETALADMSRR
ncbi:MAG TPA: Gfo/Idh/MocA family oxidoreductase [Acidimicrobiales bacterium]|nr:Gfo/Idh/MocA family oxidoreductase [Acidimicrobiales bacterium]